MRRVLAGAALVGLAALLVAAAAAMAHIERPAYWPDPRADSAVHPPAGDWMYVVKCEKNGLSCFAVSFDDHKKNVELARQRGAI